MIAETLSPGQARPPRPTTTLRPGEIVVVGLRGPAAHRLNQCGGEVIAADAVAVRVRLAWTMVDLRSSPAHGEMVVPWSRVDRVTVEAPR